MGSRHWCITFYKEPLFLPTIICGSNVGLAVRYGIYGKETCPSTGKIHWQSYIELKRNCRIAGLKKLFEDKTLHAEIRKGSREEARDYCKKDGDFVESGDWIKGQGHRTDLNDIIKEMHFGKKLSEVIMEYPKEYCQYRNGLKDIASVVTKSKSWHFRKVEVILLTGPTGCGKTRFAMQEMENKGYKICGSNLAWWQDYEAEECILIDEYDNDIKVTELLNILDGYELRLNVKGSHTYANWNKVYITTNLKPEELHRNAKPAHRDALFRRITQIKSYWEEEEICDEVVQG